MKKRFEIKLAEPGEEVMICQPFCRPEQDRREQRSNQERPDKVNQQSGDSVQGG